MCLLLLLLLLVTMMTGKRAGQPSSSQYSYYYYHYLSLLCLLLSLAAVSPAPSLALSLPAAAAPAFSLPVSLLCGKQPAATVSQHFRKLATTCSQPLSLFHVHYHYFFNCYSEKSHTALLLLCYIHPLACCVCIVSLYCSLFRHSEVGVHWQGSLLSYCVCAQAVSLAAPSQV